MGDGWRGSGQLWPHQIDAVGAVLGQVGTGGRTSVVAACGTGKTRIGAEVAARLGVVGRVLVVVPTIELMVQALAVYRAGAGGRAVVAVCGDASLAEREMVEGRPGVVVTTVPDVLAQVLAGRGGATVLSTYASVPVVAAAHAHHGLAEWDLIVVDEAHRTTGKAGGAWKAVHRDAQVPARRRLYMTATPRVSIGEGDELVSMDDRAVFGSVAYRLPFSSAIDLGLLADYRVVMPMVTSDEALRLTANEAVGLRLGAGVLSPALVAGQIAVLRTMGEFGVRRAISYHHRVAAARTWASTLPATAGLMPNVGLGALWSGHVSGAQSPTLRRRVLDRLADPGGELVVVSNARVLNEGVDVPAVDAVVFAEPRRSAIDTIQAVGRAMRTGGRTDKTATIVVPLVLAEGQSPQAALETSVWDGVWMVLRALRDHDDRLAEQLRLLRTGLGQGRGFQPFGPEHRLPPWMTITGIEVPDDFAQAVVIRAVRAATPSWDEYFGAARAFRHAHDGQEIPQDTVTAEGLRIGAWWAKQRAAYNAGILPADRAALLDVEGIVWDQLEEAWLATFAEIAADVERQGHFAFDPQAVTARGVNKLNWASAQRARHRAGKLAAGRIERLEAIGFPWDGAADRWLRRYAEVKAVHDRRGSLLRLPAASREGIWLENQRIAHKSGRLAGWQHALLTQLGVTLADRRDALWANSLAALTAFHAEEGHWTVPPDLTTVDGINLRTWCGTLRAQHANGTLDSKRAELLERAGFP
ncbi:Helicase associated domain protein [Catenulispora yoronensis]